ncbi:hypothetical protein F5888DRAFT_338449 [Russula emetica]|nr:hypothetical protein F5888DRAFT_338449 [Russula emetica]
MRLPDDGPVLLLKKEVLHEGVYEMLNKRVSRIMRYYMNLYGPSIVPVPPPLLTRTSWPYYKLQISLQLQDFGAVLAGCVIRFRPVRPILVLGHLGGVVVVGLLLATTLKFVRRLESTTKDKVIVLEHGYILLKTRLVQLYHEIFLSLGSD